MSEASSIMEASAAHSLASTAAATARRVSRTATRAMTTANNALEKVRRRKAGPSDEVTVLKEWDSTEVQVDVLCPCSISVLRKKLAGAMTSSEDQTVVEPTSLVLVFRGRLLRDEENVPEACFDADNDDPKREPHEIWVSRRRVIHLDGQRDTRRDAPADATGHQSLFEAPAAAAAETTETESFLDGASKQTMSSGSRRWPPHFDVEAELARVGCGHVAAALDEEGYGDSGAFALLTDDILAERPFYFSRGVRRKILNVARVVKEKEEKVPSSILEEMAATNENNMPKEQGGAYTTDNNLFFDSRSEVKKFWRKARAVVDVGSWSHAGYDSTRRSGVPWLGSTDMGKSVPAIYVDGISLQDRLNELLQPVVVSAYGVDSSMSSSTRTGQAETVEALERVLTQALDDRDQLRAMLDANDQVGSISPTSSASRSFRPAAAAAAALENDSHTKSRFYEEMSREAMIHRLAMCLYDSAAAHRPPPSEQKSLPESRAIKQIIDKQAEEKRTNLVERALHVVVKRTGLMPRSQKLVDTIRKRPDCNLDQFDLPADHVKPPKASDRPYCCDKHAKRARNRLADLGERHRDQARDKMRRFFETHGACHPTYDDLRVHIISILEPRAQHNDQVPAASSSNSLGEEQESLSTVVEELLEPTKCREGALLGAAPYDRQQVIDAVGLAAAAAIIKRVNPVELNNVLSLIRARDSARPAIHISDADHGSSVLFTTWGLHQALDDHARALELLVEFRNSGLLQGSTQSICVQK